jgi:hypothetical protein
LGTVDDSILSLSQQIGRHTSWCAANKEKHLNPCAHGHQVQLSPTHPTNQAKPNHNLANRSHPHPPERVHKHKGRWRHQGLRQCCEGSPQQCAAG